jgi:hypothetical protein
LFLLCLISCVSAFGQKPAPAADASPNVVGTWEGTLAAGTAKLKLVLHIDAAKDGALVGRLDVPAQGASDLPIDSLSIADNSLKFEMKSLGAAYEGKLEAMGIKSAASSGRVARRSLSFLTIRAGLRLRSVLAIRKVAAGGHTLSLLVGGEELRPSSSKRDSAPV